MDESIRQALELEELAVKDGLQTIASTADKECNLAMEGIVAKGARPPKHKFLQIRLEQLEKEIRLQVERRRVSGEAFSQLLQGHHLENLRQALHKQIDERCNRLRSLTQNQTQVPSRLDPRRDEASRLKEIADGLLKQLQLAPKVKGEGPLVFISCGQYTDEERSLGKAVERVVNELTGVDAYFAENQNSLEALSQNVFSSLKRASGFIAIMHHRGRVETHSGGHVRGSLWIEQEIAIAAFLQFSTGQKLPVILYVQQDENGTAIKREGVREQLRLDPVHFVTSEDVLSNLRERIEDGQFNPRHGAAKARSAKEEQRYKKAQAALEKYGEDARIVIGYLQNVEEFKEGAAYDDPPPPGMSGQKMREMLERLREEELLAVTMVEGPNPSRTFRIAPGMKAVLDELV